MFTHSDRCSVKPTPLLSNASAEARVLRLWGIRRLGSAVMLAALGVAASGCGDTIPPDFERGTVTGTVTVDRQAKAGAAISMTALSSFAETHVTPTDASGTYERVLGRNSWRLSVGPIENAQCPGPFTVSVQNGQTHVQDFACTSLPGILHGTVINDGAPAAGLTVQIVNQSSADVITTTTDAAGVFSVELQVGTYAAFASIPGSECTSNPLTVPVVSAEIAVSNIDCVVVPGTLTGVVTIDAQPVAGAPVSIFAEDSEGALVEVASARTDSEGRYTVAVTQGIRYPSLRSTSLLCPGIRDVEVAVVSRQQATGDIPCFSINGVYDARFTERGNTCGTDVQDPFGATLQVGVRVSPDEHVSLDIDVGDRSEDTRVTGPFNADDNSVQAVSPPFLDPQGVTILETWAFTVRVEGDVVKFDGLLNVNFRLGAFTCDKDVLMTATRTAAGHDQR